MWLDNIVPMTDLARICDDRLTAAAEHLGPDARAAARAIREGRWRDCGSKSWAAAEMPRLLGTLVCSHGPDATLLLVAALRLDYLLGSCKPGSAPVAEMTAALLQLRAESDDDLTRLGARFYGAMPSVAGWDAVTVKGFAIEAERRLMCVRSTIEHEAGACLGREEGRVPSPAVSVAISRQRQQLVNPRGQAHAGVRRFAATLLCALCHAEDAVIGDSMCNLRTLSPTRPLDEAYRSVPHLASLTAVADYLNVWAVAGLTIGTPLLGAAVRAAQTAVVRLVRSLVPKRTGLHAMVGMLCEPPVLGALQRNLVALSPEMLDAAEDVRDDVGDYGSPVSCGPGPVACGGGGAGGGARI